MLSNLSPCASNAAASSGIVGRVVVSAFDAVVATIASRGAASEGSLAAAAGGAASEGSLAAAAGGAASEGSLAAAAGGAAGEGSPAGAAGGAASKGTGSIRGSPSMRELTSRTAALLIDNALLSAISGNSLMTPIVAATGSVTGTLCTATLMPAAITIPVAASQKRPSGKTLRATAERDDAGLGDCATSAMAGGSCSLSIPLRTRRGLSRIPRAM